MWRDVKWTLGPGPQTLLAAMAVGAVLALERALVALTWGGAPFPELLALATTIGVWPLFPRGASWRAALGGALLLLAPVAIEGVAPGPRLETAAAVLPAIIGVGGALCLATARRELVRFGAGHVALAGVAAACLPGGVGAGAVLGVVLLVGLHLARSPEVADLGARRLRIGCVRLPLGVVLATAGLAAWMLVRSPLAPAPAAVDALLVGAGLGDRKSVV